MLVIIHTGYGSFYLHFNTCSKQMAEQRKHKTQKGNTYGRPTSDILVIFLLSKQGFSKIFIGKYLCASKISHFLYQTFQLCYHNPAIKHYNFYIKLQVQYKTDIYTKYNNKVLISYLILL